MENYISSMSQAIIAFSTIIISSLSIAYYIKQISIIDAETIVLLICAYILSLVLVIIWSNKKLKWKQRRTEWNM